MTKQQHQQLSEGSRAGDLDFLISNRIHFDEFNSKMGKPDAVVTASFMVKQREPALDLVSFLENGYDWILDADISSGEVKEDQYLVFVEIQRKPDMAKNIIEMLEDLKNLTNIPTDKWEFRWYKQKSYQPFTTEEFNEIVPNTPRRYRENIEEFNQIEEKAKELDGDLARLKQLSGIR